MPAGILFLVEKSLNKHLIILHNHYYDAYSFFNQNNSTMETNGNLLHADLQVDSIAVSHLSETAKWAKFLAIMGFIFTAIIIIVALFAGTIFSTLTAGNGAAGLMSTGILTGFYLAFAVVYFVLSLYMYRFAVKMQAGLQAPDQESFNLSLMNLKLVYRIMGILTIVYLALMALGMLVGIGAAMFAS